MVSTTDLSSARQTCPRLGFLADHTLTQILNDPDAFAASAEQLFDSCERFWVQDNAVLGI